MDRAPRTESSFGAELSRFPGPPRVRLEIVIVRRLRGTETLLRPMRPPESRPPDSRRIHVALLGGEPYALTTHRRSLVQALLADGHRVTGIAGGEDHAVRSTFESWGGRYESYPLTRSSTRATTELRSARGAIRVVRRVAPDVVLGYTPKGCIYGALAARAAGVPSVSFMTGLGSAFLARGLRHVYLQAAVRPLLFTAFASNRAVILQNEDDFAELRRIHVLSRATPTHLVNGSGVDLEHFLATPLPDGPPVFLMLSRLQKDKGLVEYVEAARALRSKHPEVRCLLMGPFDDHPVAISRRDVETWESEGAIEYLGVANDVRGAIGRASVLVLPSYREGTPRVVLEAMAMARAIVTTDVPGCRQTTVHGENGLLLPARDSSALERAMRLLVEEPARIGAMGRASRARAEAMFDARDVNRTIRDVLLDSVPSVLRSRS